MSSTHTCRRTHIHTHRIILKQLKWLFKFFPDAHLSVFTCPVHFTLYLTNNLISPENATTSVVHFLRATPTLEEWCGPLTSTHTDIHFMPWYFFSLFYNKIPHLILLPHVMSKTWYIIQVLLLYRLPSETSAGNALSFTISLLSVSIWRPGQHTAKLTIYKHKGLINLKHISDAAACLSKVCAGPQQTGWRDANQNIELTYRTHHDWIQLYNLLCYRH